MVKKLLLLVIFNFSYAEEWIIDKARVLDIESKAAINLQLEALNAQTNTKSYIVIQKYSNQVPQVLANELFEKFTNYQSQSEGTIFLLITENAIGEGRRIHLSTSGNNTIDKIHDNIVKQLLDSFIYDFTVYNNYAIALKNYTKNLEYYLTVKTNNFISQEKNSLNKREIIYSGLAGLITTLLSFLGIKRRYKLNSHEMPTLCQENVNLQLSQSSRQFLSSDVSYRVIPTSSSSRNISTTHRSNLGNRHGGGGRSF